MKDVKISVLLPVKDCFMWKLRRCVYSILNQSYTNIELIIKYNGASRVFNQIKDMFDDDRIIFDNSDDNSITEALNKAIRLATGDLISIFANDDVYCDGAFQALVDNIDSSQWYFGDLNYYSHGKPVQSYYISDPTLEHMKSDNLIPQPTCFFKRGVYEAVGKFDESFMLCYDYDYWVRIMKKYGSPKYIPFKIADYYLNSESISFTVGQDRMDTEKEMVFRKHFLNE